MGAAYSCAGSGQQLLTAAGNGDINTVRLILEKHPTAASYSTYLDKTSPLLLAAGRGHHHLVQLILEIAVTHEGPERAKAVCINHANRKGHSALILACMNGHSTIVEYLITNGASPLIFDVAQHNTCLHWAAFFTRSECIHRLLGSRAIYQLQSGTIVAVAEIPCYDEDGVHRVKFVDRRNGWGLTALHIAVFKGSISTVRALLRHGASLTSRTLPATRDHCPVDCAVGSNVLHIAAVAGNIGMVRVILEMQMAQGSPDLRSMPNDRGQKPRDCLRRSRHAVLLNLLDERLPMGTTQQLLARVHIGEREGHASNQALVPQLKRLKLVLTLETLGTQKQLTAAAAALAQQHQDQQQEATAAAAAGPPLAIPTAASTSAKQQQQQQQQSQEDAKDAAAAVAELGGCSDVGNVKDSRSPSHLVMAVAAAAAGSRKPGRGGGSGGGAATAAVALGALERRLQLLQQLEQQAREVLTTLEDSRKGNQGAAAGNSTTSGAAGAAASSVGDGGVEVHLQQGASPSPAGGGGGFRGGVEGGFGEGGESTMAVLGSEGGSVAPSLATASGVASAAGSLVEANTPHAAGGGGRGRGGSSSVAIVAAAGGQAGSEARGFSAHRLLRRRSGRRRGTVAGAVQEVSETSLALEQPAEPPLLSLESFVPARTVSALHQAIKALVKCSSLSKKQQEANAAAAAAAAEAAATAARGITLGAGGVGSTNTSSRGRSLGDGEGAGLSNLASAGVINGLGHQSVQGAATTPEGPLANLVPTVSPALGTAGAVGPHFTFSQGAIWSEQEQSFGLLKSCLQSIQACITLGQQVLDHLSAAGTDDAALERLLPSALEGLDDRLFALSTGMMLPHPAAASGYGAGLSRVSPLGLQGLHGGSGFGGLGGGGLLGGEEPIRLQLLPRAANSSNSSYPSVGLGRGPGGFTGAGWDLSGPRAAADEQMQEQQQGALDDELGLLLGRSLRSANGRGSGGPDAPVSVEWRLLDQGSAPTGAFLPINTFGSSSGRISLSRRSQDGVGDRGSSNSSSSSRRGLRHRHRHASRSNQSSTIMSRERSLLISPISLNPLGSRLPSVSNLRHQVTPVYDPLDLPGRHTVPNNHHHQHQRNARGSSSSLRGRVSLLQPLSPRSAEFGIGSGSLGGNGTPVAPALTAAAAEPIIEAESLLLRSVLSRRGSSARSSSNSNNTHLQQHQQQWHPLLPNGGGPTLPANPLNPGEVVVGGTVSNTTTGVPLAAGPYQQQQGEVGLSSGSTRGWGFLLEHLAQTTRAQGRSSTASQALASSSGNNQNSSTGATVGTLRAEGGAGQGGVTAGSIGLDAGAAAAEVLRASRVSEARGSGEVAAEAGHRIRESNSYAPLRSAAVLSTSSRPAALQVPGTPPAAAGGLAASPATPYTYATADSLVSGRSPVSSLMGLASARSSIAAGSGEDTADASVGDLTGRQHHAGAANGHGTSSSSRPLADEQPSSTVAAPAVAGGGASAGMPAVVLTARRLIWGRAPEISAAGAPSDGPVGGSGSRTPAGIPSSSLPTSSPPAAAGGSSRSAAFGSSCSYRGNGAAAPGGGDGSLKVLKCAGGEGGAGGSGLGGGDLEDRKQRLLAYNAAAGAVTDGSLAEEEAGTCPICMDRPVALQVSRCAHGLCLVCAFQLCSKGRTAALCPFCRQTIGDFEAAAASTI